MRLLFSILSFLLISTAFCAEKRTYTIGVEEINYAPYYFVNSKKEFKGFARELFDRFAAENDISFKYEPLPIKRLFRALYTSETIDFKFPSQTFWNKDVKRGCRVFYSDPIVQYIDGLMIPKESKVSTAKELKIIGVVNGFTIFEYLHYIKEGSIKSRTCRNLETVVKNTIAGNTDAAYGNIAVIQEILRTRIKRPDALKFGSNLPHTRSSYLLSTKKHPDVIEKFDIFLSKEKEFVQTLKLKYGLN